MMDKPQSIETNESQRNANATLKDTIKDISTALLVFFMPLLAIALGGVLLIGGLYVLYLFGVI